jgi:hypothetical protein
MRLLMFQAKRFWWKSFSKTLDEVEDIQAEEEVTETIVVYMHVEAKDATDRERVVLHSFTHLGGENAEPDFASAFINELADRLRATDYEVWVTPFGYFNEWELSVYGESLGKVWKSF